MKKDSSRMTNCVEIVFFRIICKNKKPLQFLAKVFVLIFDKGACSLAEN